MVEDVVPALDRGSNRDLAAGLASLFARYGHDALVVPFIDAFPRIGHAAGRSAVLFFLIRFAREQSAVVDLATRALTDEAELVRREACAVLAFSLREDVLPALEALASRPDDAAREWAVAAMDAITHRNHHYFLDRAHTGTIRWTPDAPDRGSTG